MRDWVLRHKHVSAALLYAAICATVIVFLWQMHAQRHMSSARAALLFCFEPVVAALASWLWVGERLTGTQWAGGALIVAGMVVAELPARRPTPSPPPAQG